MNCNIQTKTLDYLKKKGLIVENRNIPTEKLEAFNTENESLTKYAKDSKGVDMGPLFTVEDNTKERKGRRSTQFINRAVPNTKAFDAIQKYNDDNILEKNINYQLKAVDILNSDKAKQVFSKGKKNGWDLNKILTELQIPKEQKQIILDKEENIRFYSNNNSEIEYIEQKYGKENVDLYFQGIEEYTQEDIKELNKLKGSNLREEIITSLLAENSFVVEVNTARKSFGINPVTEKEELGDNTEYYSNLTVPGGTNYTENEIATPDITPNIKGHAQFSTDNGIGWFRSDDKVSNFKESYKGELNNVPSDILEEMGYISNKTRRILEVQSDLFQKGRNSKNLSNTVIHNKDFKGKIGKVFKHNTTGEIVDESDMMYGNINPADYTEINNNTDAGTGNDNQFLQLLNKKNNWVNFFIESIIQDSAKKGYKKVLFPKGDTAAKIEGHQTLEEFKKQKQARIKYLKDTPVTINEDTIPLSEVKDRLMSTEMKLQDTEEELSHLDKSSEQYLYIKDHLYSLRVYHKQLSDSIKNVKNFDKEIDQLKKELADVESGQTQLSSIAGFYENTVTNILNKKYKGRVTEVTDEYGNKWNEVELNLEDSNNSFVLQMQTRQESKPEIKSFIYNSKKVSKRDVNASNDVINKNKDDIINDLFNGKAVNMTSNEFLRNALSNPALEINDAGKKLIRAMLTTRSKIKFVSKDALKNEGTYAQYDSNTRIISINEEILATGNTYYALEAILHEIVHDFTVNALKAPKNDAQRAFRENIRAAFRYYNEHNTTGLYGFTNEAEFVAEIMTNSEFLNELKSIEKGSLFNRIINFIKSLFGINSDLPNSSEIIKSIFEIIETEYDNHKSPLNSNTVYEKNTSEQSSTKTNNDALNDKLTDVKSIINKILSSIDAVKRKSISSKGYDKKKQNKFDKITKLLDKLASKEPKKAILEYLSIAESEIIGLIKGLDAAIEDESVSNDYLKRSRDYATVFNYMSDISKVVSVLKQEKKISREEYNEITEVLDSVTAKYKRYRTETLTISKNLTAKKFASFNTLPITKAKQKYSKEYKTLKIQNKTKEQYVNEKLDENQESIAQQQYNEVRSQMDRIPSDISSYNAMLETEKNIPNLVIHLASLALDMAESEIRESSVNLRNQMVFDAKQYDAKGNTNEKKYGKLLDGQYLINKYKSSFLLKYNELKNNINDAEVEFGVNSKEHKNARRAFIKWKNENTKKVYEVNEDNVKYLKTELPTNKWLNPKYAKLTTKDKVFLQKLTDSALRSDLKTNNVNSLINQPLAGKNSKDSYTVVKLPSIRRTDTDMLLSGNAKQLIKDKIGDLGKKRQDDTDFGEITQDQIDNTLKVMATMDGQTKNVIPVFYRAPIEMKDQSIDLPTIFLLNESMAVNFEVKSKLEADMTMLKDIVSEADVRQVETLSGLKKVSAYLGFNKKEHDEILNKGLNSNIYKKLTSMLENRMYNITEVSAGKVVGLDVNKLTSGIAGYSADLTLGLNYLSAMPNMLQAKIQNFIEGVGIGTYTRADLRFAEKEYWSQMAKNGLNDIGALKNENKINLLIEKFDLMGDFNVIKNLIEDDTKMRALMKRGTLHSMNSMAEHYAQSTLMLAVMNSVKIKNTKGQYINKSGSVVTKEEAMTLYEAFDVVDNTSNKSKELKLNSKAVSTSFSNAKLTELGMIQHQNLIKKKVIDLHGQYDNKIQSHIQRYWYGKLFFMFRKWMLSSYKRRFRGLAHAGKSWDLLTEEQRQYDYSLQEYEEGTYVSFFRFMKTGVFDSIRNLELELLTSNWNNLSDKEKANVYKVTRELMLTALAYASTLLLAGFAEDDEENEDYYYTLAYVVRRQQSELMQYYHIGENIRVFRTPFAALTTVEKIKDVLVQIMPWAIDERYETGKNKGELKSWIKFKKIVPYVAQSERSAKQSLQFLQNVTN